MTSQTMTADPGLGKNRPSKKQQILDAALNLFVQQGIEATATAQIAKRAGVATGTLFHHFASKEALIQALYWQIKQQLADAALAAEPSKEEDDLKRQARHYWDCALGWALAHPDALKFIGQLYHSPARDEHLEQQAMTQLLHFVPRMLEQGSALGLLRSAPMDLTLALCHSHFLASAHYFILHPQKATQSTYLDSAFEHLWNGLLHFPLHEELVLSH
ncbi:TetR/AcrR family transcriptional regulator [Ferrimonas pelagia]|uniref:TetR/AcrR family transcriptional regulator n=1 Tax=Ferrimonas pelagia TaxID=1177826 RepID=A0ABP9EF69_9GAMM